MSDNKVLTGDSIASSYGALIHTGDTTGVQDPTILYDALGNEINDIDRRGDYDLNDQSHQDALAGGPYYRFDGADQK